MWQDPGVREQKNQKKFSKAAVQRVGEESVIIPRATGSHRGFKQGSGMVSFLFGRSLQPQCEGFGGGRTRCRKVSQEAKFRAEGSGGEEKGEPALGQSGLS